MRLTPPPITTEEAELRAWLRKFSTDRPRWGWRRAAKMARRAGWRVNDKRIRRLWREEGLRVPQRRRKKRLTGVGVAVGAMSPIRPNVIWAMDFQFDTTADGRNIVAPAKRIRITPGRALLLALMDQYATVRAATDPLSETGVSHLEVQKLLYFATTVAPNPRMKFVQGKYGPYSDSARHMLQEIEGSYTSGYGDGDDHVLALRPIEVTSQGRQQMMNYLDRLDSTAVSATVDRVLAIVAGFEGAYGLELLATTHWVASHEGAVSEAEATAAVRKWSERKGRIFTQAHVGNALEHLRATGALSSNTTPT
jgi:O-acetyl-ADP-ribose deacetylase (regulator of RNase III)